MDDRKTTIRGGEAPLTGETRVEPRIEAAADRETVAVLTPGGGRPADDAPRLAAAPAPAAKRDWTRPVVFAALGTLALGGLAGLLLAPRGDRDADRAPAPAAVAERDPRPDGAPRAAVAYAPPSDTQVGNALQRVRTDYAAGGASEVARVSRACFDRLSGAPGFAQLDFCLAYDQYGTAMMRRLAGGAGLSSDSWFGRTDARGTEAARAVIGEAGDADARVLDIRRLAAAASRQAAPNTQVARAEPATAPASTPPVQVAQAPIVPVLAAPTPTPARPTPRQVAEAPRVPVAPSRVEPPRPAAPRAEPAPVVRVQNSARPSFNCRYARSASERLVCSDPVLAAADWRLHNVFERAMASSPNPRVLRAEQDRWLSAREAAAPDAGDVLDTYEARIDELSRY